MGFRGPSFPWRLSLKTALVLGAGILAPSCAPEAPDENTAEDVRRQETTLQPLDLGEVGRAAGEPLFALRDSVFSETPPPGGSVEAPADMDDPTAAGAIVLGDIDGDGRPDVLVVQGKVRLYRQTERLRFEDITEKAGVGGSSAWGTGAALADIDKDGDLDLYVCNLGSPNQCYVNQGDGTFTEKGGELGLDVSTASLMPAFADFDGDGDLDLYLLTNRYRYPGGIPAEAVHVEGERMVVARDYERYFAVRAGDGGSSSGTLAYEVVPVGQPDRLFRNRGDGSFELMKEAGAGLGITPSIGTSVVWLDLERDGDLDLMLTHEGDGVLEAYRNDGGGQFERVTEETFSYAVADGRGGAVEDIDGDGRLDFLVLAGREDAEGGKASAEGLQWEGSLPVVSEPVLWLGAGGGRFRGEALKGPVNEAIRDAGAVLAEDFDLDGVRDLVLASATGLQGWRGKEREGDAEGKIVFEEAGADWGFGANDGGRVSVLAKGDLDADGDVDVLARTADGRVHLWENRATGGRRMVVRLVSADGLMPPVGARLRAWMGRRSVTKGLYPAGGGLGGHGSDMTLAWTGTDEIGSMLIWWPSGRIQEVEDLPGNHLLTLVEPASSESEGSVEVAGEEGAVAVNDSRGEEGEESVHALFQVATQYDYLRHEESRPPGPFREENYQGPGMACTDINDDGLDDVYLGGAAGRPGKLYLRRSDGFRSPLIEPFVPHAASEDLGSLFVDLNADGYLDLLVVSGGNEAEPGAESYRDRLYLGNGRGGFVHDPGALPDLRESGGLAAAADVDHDGDLDLFIGGPGSESEEGVSRLLINGYVPGQPLSFAVSPWTLAGRVKSALWTDVDLDGWPDLLVVDERRGPRLFKNIEGEMQERPLGVAFPEGRWSSIAPGDVDQDQSIDYALTNLAGPSGVLKNSGRGTFTWQTLPEAPFPAPARAAMWMDADGDMQQDLFVVHNEVSVAGTASLKAAGLGQVYQGSEPRGTLEPMTAAKSGFLVSGYATAMALTELNGDGAPDFLIARTNAPVVALERRGSLLNWLTIRFRGPLRNVMGIGARITIDFNRRPVLAAELTAGSGYLAQSANRIFFPRATPGQGVVTVHWPDGKTDTMAFSDTIVNLLVRY